MILCVKTFALFLRCPFDIGSFGGNLARADGNRSSVSSEGFCENDADGEILPIVLAAGRVSNSSSSSGNDSSSSSNSSERNHLRNGARPKEVPTRITRVTEWNKDVKDLDIDINCFGFDEAEHAFLAASRSGNTYPKDTKKSSNSTDNEDDEDVGLYDVACSSKVAKNPPRETQSESPSDDNSKESEEAEKETTDDVNQNDSGAGEEEGACGPAPATENDNAAERRPSKDDSVASSTSDSYHYSGDDYTVYYYDPKATADTAKSTSQGADSDKKEDKASVSPTIDKLLENVKKETDPWENLFAR